MGTQQRAVMAALVLLSWTALYCSATACDFGMLPGVWQEGEIGNQWRSLTLTGSCKLRNLVGPHLSQLQHQSQPQHQSHLQSSASPSARQGRSGRGPAVLFLSDSMDFYLLEAFCNATNGSVTNTHSRMAQYHSLHACHSPTGSRLQNEAASDLKLAQMYIITFTNASKIQFPAKKMRWTSGLLRHGYADRFLAAKHGFRRSHGCNPGAVVISGGYWDLFAWLDGIGNEQLGNSIRKSNTLPANLLSDWMRKFAAAVQLARQLWPRAVLMYHNYALPLYDFRNGKTAQKHLGSKRLVAEINAAGMSVAHAAGLKCIDVNSMVASFAEPSRYLADRLHPRHWVSLEVLNIILNILADEQQRQEWVQRHTMVMRRV